MPLDAMIKDACILGHPIGHSLSPVMHNAGFKAAGLDWRFTSIDVSPQDLPQAVERLRSFRGASITMPHKRSVIGLLDGISPQSRHIGAVNVVVNEDGSLVGDNTDGAGLVRYLERDLGLSPASATLLGSGGSARAIAFALGASGTRVTVCARRESEAESVAALAGDQGRAGPWERRNECVRGSELLVSTLPFTVDPRLEASALRDAKTIVDIAAFKTQTPLQRAAADAGRTVHDGLGMLLHQGFLAFRLWTGLEAPEAAMTAAVRAQSAGV